MLKATGTTKLRPEGAAIMVFQRIRGAARAGLMLLCYSALLP
jgi:hypothetical protein